MADSVVLYLCPLDGLDVERAELQRWALTHHADVVAEVVCDPAELQDAVRASLLDALELVIHERAGVVAVTDLAVLGADEMAQEAFRAEVERAGGRLVSLLDAPASEQRARLQAYEALRREWERARTVRQLHGAKARRREDDPEFWPGGRAAFGRRLESGKIVEDVAEMAVVARIRELRRAGHTLDGIAEILQAERYRTKEGSERWHREQVRRVLVRYGEHDETPPPDPS